MRHHKWLLCFCLGLSALALSGCSSDDDTGDSPGEPELSSDFADYRDGNHVEFTNAASPFLGPAHQGSNPEYNRSIFTSFEEAKMAGEKIEGEYPLGTTFVKETFTFDSEGTKQFAEAMGMLGMIKRGSDFDPENGNWEYFNIDPSDLSTIDSGADLGSCKSCHTLATGEVGNDFIFRHPYEYAASADAFADYENWHLLDTRQGPDALIGDAHAGNNAEAQRKIYRKQLAANPHAENDWGYPVGTLILKSVQDGEGNLIGQTGMAKRGAGFDSEHGDWEYFMWDVGNDQIMDQGALAMCIGCHAAANSDGNGADWVFAHTDDPFNN